MILMINIFAENVIDKHNPGIRYSYLQLNISIQDYIWSFTKVDFEVKSGEFNYLNFNYSFNETYLNRLQI